MKSATDIYWAWHAPEVQQLRYLSGYIRRVRAVELAKKGYRLIRQVAEGNADPQDMYTRLAAAGFAWVWSMGESKPAALVMPGLQSEGLNISNLPDGLNLYDPSKPSKLAIAIGTFEEDPASIYGYTVTPIPFDEEHFPPNTEAPPFIGGPRRALADQEGPTEGKWYECYMAEDTYPLDTPFGFPARFGITGSPEGMYVKRDFNGSHFWQAFEN